MGWALIILGFLFVGVLAYCGHSVNTAKDILTDLATKSAVYTQCLGRRMKQEPYANRARAKQLDKYCAKEAGLTDEEFKAMSVIQ